MMTERDGLVLKRVLDEMLCRRTPGCPWLGHAGEPLCVNCAARELLQAQADALSAAQRLIEQWRADYGWNADTSVAFSIAADALAAALSERSPRKT